MKIFFISILFLITNLIMPIEILAEESTPSMTDLPTISDIGDDENSEEISNATVYDGKKYPVSGFGGVEDGFSTAINYMTVIVIAFFGVSIPFICWEGVKAIKTTPSLAIFLLGSTIYLVGELLTTIMYKNLAAKDASVLINKENLGKQIESFEELKKKHESYLSTLKLKLYLAIGVAVVYVAAGIAAIIEMIMKKELACSPNKKSEKSGSTDSKSGSSSSSSTKSSDAPKPTSTTTPPGTVPRKPLPKPPIKTSPATGPKALMTILSLLTQEACAQDIGGMLKGVGGGIIPDISDISFSDMTETYSMVKLILLGLGGGLGITFGLIFKKIVSTQKNFFNKMLMTSTTRIALSFGSASAVGFFIPLLLKQQEKLKKRIKYLDSLIKTLQGFNTSMNNGNAISNLYDDVTNYIPPVTLPEEISNELPSGNNLPCATSGTSDPRVLRVDKNCQCKSSSSSSSSCTPKTIPDARNSSFNFPGGISSTLGGASGALNELSKGNISGALGQLTGAGRNAAKLNRLKKQYLDALNKKLKEEKKAPFDLTAEQNKIFGKIGGSIKKEFRNNKISEKSLADWGNQTFGLGQEKELPSLSQSKSEQAISQSEAKEAKEENEKGGDDSSFNDFVINNEENSAEQFTPPPPPEGGTVMLDEDIIDINQNDSSLFEILSDRYVKSAYPKIFKKVEETEEAKISE